MKKNKKEEQTPSIFQAVLMALTTCEALCGEEYVDTLAKRLQILSNEAQCELWLRVYNAISFKSLQVKTPFSIFKDSMYLEYEADTVVKDMNQKSKGLTPEQVAEMAFKIGQEKYFV